MIRSCLGRLRGCAWMLPVAGCGSSPSTAADRSTEGGPAGVGDAAANPTPEEADAAGDSRGAWPGDSEGGSSLGDASCDSGLLCGPADRPCQLKVDQTIASPSLVGNANGNQVSLALAGDSAYLLFGSSPGFVFAARDPSTAAWTIEAAPGASPFGSLALAPDGTVRTIDSAASVWTRGPGGWQWTAATANTTILGPWAVTVDGTGTIHALASSPNSGQYLRWNGQYTMQSLGGASGNGTVALSTAGGAQFAYWGSVPQWANWALVWALPDGTTEGVSPYGNLSLDGRASPIALAVAQDATAQPSLLFSRLVAGGGDASAQAFELVYAARTAPQTWSTATLATGDTAEFSLPPGAGGAGSPTFQYTTYRPISVLTDKAGGTRFVFAQLNVSASVICEGPGEGQLACGAVVASVTARLHLGWVCGAGGYDDVILFDGLHPARTDDSFAPVVVGADGSIHVALVEAAATPAGNPTGRYLVFSP